VIYVTVQERTTQPLSWESDAVLATEQGVSSLVKNLGLFCQIVSH